MVTPLTRTNRLAASKLAAAVPVHQRTLPPGCTTRKSVCSVRSPSAMRRPHRLQPVPVFGMDHGADVLDGDLRSCPRSTPKMWCWPSSHLHSPRDGIPVPRPHLPGGQRQTAALLALQQPRVRGFELRRALAHAPLQLGIQPLQLARLAVKLGEYLDLGAQHRRNDRHRHVIDRAHLVAAQAIDVVHLDGGDEDDRRALKPRMLADHGRELEAVEFRHADIDQDDGGLVLEQELQSLARRSRLDQILPEIAKNLLVGEQLRGLIVHQQDIDFVVHGRSSCMAKPSDAATSATRRAAVRC